jgi:hypothetical protein
MSSPSVVDIAAVTDCAHCYGAPFDCEEDAPVANPQSQLVATGQALGLCEILWRRGERLNFRHDAGPFSLPKPF